MLRGRTSSLAECGIVHRAEHDHAIAEREFGIGDGSSLPFVDRLLLEAEGAAQERDRRMGLLVLQRRDDGRDRVLGNLRHAVLSG